jgi:gluconolactonase
VSVTADSPKLHDLVAPDAQVDQLATGFTFTEGPIWMPDGTLLFSDMPADKRRRWDPARGVSVVRESSDQCNGMTVDNDGALIVCQHATSTVVRETADGARETVASHWQERELNSPNDVVVAGDGSILFSDPTYGRMPGFGRERELELDFRGVYRVRAGDGELQVLADDFGQPNGLCFSPDESVLYVNDTEHAHIRAFDVATDGSLGNGRIFAAGISDSPRCDDGRVDGMKVDELGNVYVTGPGGIWIFAPSGERLGTIAIPEVAANMNWGDGDWRTLYITASTSLYRLRCEVGGNRLGYMQ